MKPIVITGGPGAGKTTLLNALGKQGYATFAEASRSLIEQQSALDNGICRGPICLSLPNYVLT